MKEMTAGMLPQMPEFDTHVPFVGKVNFNSPVEWLFWGGLAFDLFFVSGFSKWIIAAGIIAARYELRECYEKGHE